MKGVKEEDKTHCERKNPFRVISVPLAPAEDDAMQDRDQVLGQGRREEERQQYENSAPSTSILGRGRWRPTHLSAVKQTEVENAVLQA